MQNAWYEIRTIVNNREPLFRRRQVIRIFCRMFSEARERFAFEMRGFRLVEGQPLPYPPHPRQTRPLGDRHLPMGDRSLPAGVRPFLTGTAPTHGNSRSHRSKSPKRAAQGIGVYFFPIFRTFHTFDSDLLPGVWRGAWALCLQASGVSA
jgi:hypothetical protein